MWITVDIHLFTKENMVLSNPSPRWRKPLFGVVSVFIQKTALTSGFLFPYTFFSPNRTLTCTPYFCS
jgi:hypothetical protein